MASLAALCGTGHAAALAVDAESGDVYLAVEKKAEEGSVKVEIVRIRSGAVVPEVGHPSAGYQGH